MAGYPYVGQIKEDATRKAVQAAYDLLGTLQARLAALETASLQSSGQGVDAGGQKLRNVAQPEAATDGATAGWVRAYVSAQLEAFANNGLTATVDTGVTPVLEVVRGRVTEVS